MKNGVDTYGISHVAGGVLFKKARHRRRHKKVPEGDKIFL